MARNAARAVSGCKGLLSEKNAPPNAWAAIRDVSHSWSVFSRSP
jgi:hypothetical protein